MSFYNVGVNRSKLTRLVVDSGWDKKVFNSNWSKEREAVYEQKVVLEEEGVFGEQHQRPKETD